MQEIQIDILQPEILQARLKRLLDTCVVCRPQLRRHENIFPLHFSRCNGLREALTYFSLVSVCEGCVDVFVAMFESVDDGVFNFSWAGLPGA